MPIKLIAVIATLLVGGLPNMALADSQAIHAQTCKHYKNRAFNIPRHIDAPLEVILADSCALAFKSLYARHDTSPYERRHARGYLDRLTLLKDTVITINLDRTFGIDRTRRSKIKVQLGDKVGASSTKQPVNKSGEYLIARQLGVIRSYREWADVTDFVVAKQN